jgi:hypothetical protein
MFCSKCGAENSKDSSFCKICGANLSVESNNPVRTEFLTYEPRFIKNESQLRAVIANIIMILCFLWFIYILYGLAILDMTTSVYRQAEGTSLQRFYQSDTSINKILFLFSAVIDLLVFVIAWSYGPATTKYSKAEIQFKINHIINFDELSERLEKVGFRNFRKNDDEITLDYKTLTIRSELSMKFIPGGVYAIAKSQLNVYSIRKNPSKLALKLLNEKLSSF